MKRDEYFAKNKNKIAEKVIDEDSEETYKSPQVLIDQLFRLFFAGKFSEQIVKEQIETVLIAGNETSALTLSYTILLLAMYPDIQEKLYEELRSAYDTQDEDTCYERVQQLPYLDMVLKEGMRMFPVAPFIVRIATADTPVSNCIIPKNAIIMMSIFNLQRVMIKSNRICCENRYLTDQLDIFRGRIFGAMTLKNSIQNISYPRESMNVIHSAFCRLAEVGQTFG